MNNTTRSVMFGQLGSLLSSSSVVAHPSMAKLIQKSTKR